MSRPVRIWALPNGMKATMSILSPHATVEDVEVEISIKHIVVGIKKDVIAESIEECRNTGNPKHNIVIAEALAPRCCLKMGEQELSLEPEALRGCKERFKTIGLLLSDCKNNLNVGNIPRGIFVAKDHEFAVEEEGKQGTTIFGKPYIVSRISGPALPCDSSVIISRTEQKLIYYAKKSGYLAVNNAGKYTIIDPLFVSEDLMSLFFLIAPIQHDLEALIKYFYSKVAAFTQSDICRALPSRAKVEEMIRQEQATPIVIREGTPAVHGRDASIHFYVQASRMPENNDDDRIDFKQVSPFQQVLEGTLLAHKELFVKGIDGANVIGDVIPAKEAVDIDFLVGKNVIQRTENGKVLYYAGCTGVLRVNHNFLEISDILHINGDVGPETGNIISYKNVVVLGNVMSGYSMECDADIFVSGAIENGASVVCKGNLTVRGGVLGVKTNIKVGGDATIGFIQEGSIHVDGDITVRKYIYNAYVICSGTVSVNGINLEGNERGCILGGMLVAMKTMQIASAGCEGETTILCCGVNPEMEQAVLLLNQKISALNKRATAIRGSLPVDLDSPRSKEVLQVLSLQEKEKVRKLLVDLKGISKEQAMYAGKVSVAKTRVYNPQINECRIMVKKHLVPQVQIRIGTETLVENKHKFSVQYKCIKDGEIKESAIPILDR